MKRVLAGTGRLIAIVAFTAATVHCGGRLPAPSPSPTGGPAVAIIPRPVSLRGQRGQFLLAVQTAIVLEDSSSADLRQLGDRARGILRESLGTLTDSVAPAGSIILALDPRVTRHDEGYRLQVRAPAIRIMARTPAGLFYGLQTLRQLISPDAHGVARVPALDIEDHPRFPYRGMHLDVGRHFFSVAFVERYIDLMARYKFNRFHWHLTEDQGWRIEIKQYPRLTTIGSRRKETIAGQNFDPYVGDGVPYGGYYTQDEIREVVAYAASRHVTIVPEIEMPGHSLAALAAYPELACTDGPFEVGTRWGVYDDIYCPTEATFTFLENVLTEVMDLFPGPYIHIGGDEAPKTRWEASPVAQEVIRREGLADEHELQSYFIRRIEDFLAAHGRRLVGWDEILEGGLPPRATVMSWRGMDGGIAAAKARHDVIMTPGSHVYFDHYQGDPDYEPLAIGGFTPLEKVYAFEPVPPELSRREAQHVLGAQGNVWTEYLQTPAQVEYMVFPRALALAEVLWSPAQRRDLQSFLNRLPSALARLDRFDVAYRVPAPQGLDRDEITLDDSVTVALGSPLPRGAIHYTLDGSDPTLTAPAYSGPLQLDLRAGAVRIAARYFLAGGRGSPLRRATYARAMPRPAVSLEASRLSPGLRGYFRSGSARTLADLDTLTVTGAVHVPEVRLSADAPAEQFGLELQGWFRAPSTSVYGFTLIADDGASLTIDDTLVVDNDGLHGPVAKSGMVALAQGFHDLRVRYFQAGGGKALALRATVGTPQRALALGPLLFSRP